MKKMYVLLMGLLCCASCDKEASKSQQQWKCCDGCPGGHLQKPIKNSRDFSFEEEKDYEDAQQAIIKKLKWGEVVIQYCKSNKIIQIKDCVLTPKSCQAWDYKIFGQDKYAQGEDPIGHVSNGKPGVQPYAIKGLLENDQGLDIVVIVSKGMDDKLGVNQKTEEYLKQLKDEDKIGAYHILNSQLVPATHNKCVGEGKRVYTLLHPTC